MQRHDAPRGAVTTPAQDRLTRISKLAIVVSSVNGEAIDDDRIDEELIQSLRFKGWSGAFIRRPGF